VLISHHEIRELKIEKNRLKDKLDEIHNQIYALVTLDGELES